MRGIMNKINYKALVLGLAVGLISVECSGMFWGGKSYNLDSVKKLLKNKIFNINSKKDGETILHTASHLGKTAIVRELLKHKNIDVDMLSDVRTISILTDFLEIGGNRALYYATRSATRSEDAIDLEVDSSSLDCCILLVMRGADVSLKKSSHDLRILLNSLINRPINTDIFEKALKWIDRNNNKKWFKKNDQSLVRQYLHEVNLKDENCFDYDTFEKWVKKNNKHLKKEDFITRADYLCNKVGL